MRITMAVTVQSSTIESCGGGEAIMDGDLGRPSRNERGGRRRNDVSGDDAKLPR